MKKRRWLAMSLAVCVCVGTLAGCGWGSDSSEEATASSDTEVLYDSDMAEDSRASSNENVASKEASESAVAENTTEYVPGYDTREYGNIDEMPFSAVKTVPVSTFGADVDTASYSNLRQYIVNGESVPQDAVRIEEMLNYFSYDYDTPQGDEPFAVTTQYGDCPWNTDTKLLQVGMKTKALDLEESGPSNLVFLLDTSGSMDEENKLPLVKQAFHELTAELTENDRISIVTYAGSDTVLLEGAHGTDTGEIEEALEGLEAYGSTNGSAGIQTAYDLAEKYDIDGGNNRVILATDGDLNVGITSEGELEQLITEKKKSGVFLSVLGFGTDNLKDNKLETLADKGDGNYAYIDSVYEAKKVLVEEMGATLNTVAKDVKFQVEFNPEQVKGYRLIGYENRVMAAEDFDDDTKDGGEIGAGHTVTALYEIVPVDSEMDLGEKNLKYQKEQTPDEDIPELTDELLTVNIRYKEPDGDKSQLETYPVKADDYTEKPSKDYWFAASVAAFGMTLRDSSYRGEATCDMALQLAEKADVGDDQYKQEYMQLIEEAKKQIETGEYEYAND